MLEVYEKKEHKIKTSGGNHMKYNVAKNVQTFIRNKV